LIVIFLKEHSRNFTSVQQVVDILQELLLDDLSVGEQEDDRLILDTCLQQGRFHILAKVFDSVVARNLNREDGHVVHHVCSEFGEGSAARTRDTDKKAVATRLTENTADATDVVSCVFEEDEVDFSVHVDVVSDESIIQPLLQRLHGRNLLVNLLFLTIDVNTTKIITKDEIFVTLRPRFHEDVLSDGSERFPPPATICLVNETIVEDTRHFVDEQANNIFFFWARRWSDLKNSLNDFTKVTKVEGVVGLGRRGKFFVRNSVITLFDCFNEKRSKASDFRLLPLFEETVQDCSEDFALRRGRNSLLTDDVEVGGQATRHFVTTTSRNTSETNHNQVADFLQEGRMLFAFEEGMLSDDLSQQFERRRSAVLFESRHVEIVDDEDSTSFLWSRSKQVVLDSAKFCFDTFLNIAGASLSRESCGEGVNTVFGMISIKSCCDEISNDGGFSCARDTSDESVALCVGENAKKILERSRLDGGDEDVEVGCVLDVRVVRNNIGKRNKSASRRVYTDVEERKSFGEKLGERRKMFLNQRTEDLIKFGTRTVSQIRAE
jgi:hypothetical protein